MMAQVVGLFSQLPKLPSQIQGSVARLTPAAPGTPHPARRSLRYLAMRLALAPAGEMPDPNSKLCREGDGGAMYFFSFTNYIHCQLLPCPLDEHLRTCYFPTAYSSRGSRWFPLPRDFLASILPPRISSFCFHCETFSPTLDPRLFQVRRLPNDSSLVDCYVPESRNWPSDSLLCSSSAELFIYLYSRLPELHVSQNAQR